MTSELAVESTVAGLEEQPPLPPEPAIGGTTMAPPLPSSPPPQEEVAPPPPPSIQMSNLDYQGLDFVPDVGETEHPDSGLSPGDQSRKSKRGHSPTQGPPCKVFRFLPSSHYSATDGMEGMEASEKRPFSCPALHADNSVKSEKVDETACDDESSSLPSGPSGIKIEKSRTEDLHLGGGGESVFQIIDVVGGEDDNYEDEDDDDGGSEEEDSEGEFVVDEEEIDAMLDQGIQQECQGRNYRAPVRKEKVILKGLFMVLTSRHWCLSKAHSIVFYFFFLLFVFFMWGRGI